MKDYIDSDGNVIVLKSIRPLMDYPETILGAKRGAKRQYRHGNLHIREYDSYYSVHEDRIDPRKDPFGHLLVDAPEYLVGILGAIYVARHIASLAQKRKDPRDRSALALLGNDTLPDVIAGLVTSTISYLAANYMKNWARDNSR